MANLTINQTKTPISPDRKPKAKTFADIKIEKDDPEALLKKSRELLNKLAENVTKEKGYIAGFVAKLQKNDWLRFSSKIFSGLGIGAVIGSLFLLKDRASQFMGALIGLALTVTSIVTNRKIIPWATRLIENYGKELNKKINLDTDLCWDPAEYTKLQRSVKEFLKPSIQTPGSTRGDLLVLAGDPGLGKTVIAKGIADLSGRKLIQIKLGGEKYIHEIERKIEDGFKDAKEVNGILFIDEADSLVRSRASKTGTSWDHSIAHITTTFMQKFDDYRSQGVKVIAATNDPNDIDQAVIDRAILNPIERPNAELRKQILLKKLEKFLSEKNLSELKASKDFDKEITDIANKYELTGRSIESSVNRAKVVSEERHDHDAADKETHIILDDLKAAFEDTFSNQEQTKKINQKAKVPEILGRMLSGRK